MSVELAVAYISLIPSAKGIDANIAKELAPVDALAAKSGESAGAKLSSSFTSKLEGLSKKVVTGLGLAAVGALAFKSAVDVEDAQNIIIRSTGATGKAADALEKSFQNVAKASPASFDQIAGALSDLNRRTGLTGTGLETLTQQILSFNRTTKDAPLDVTELTKAMSLFNIPAADMSKELDKLFVVSQKTGVPLADLVASLNAAGPVAKQFGFSLEFTAGLLAQLNKAGVDANSIMPGLRKAFVEFAKAGEDPKAALKGVLEQMDALIKKGDLLGARQLAVQIFGAKGAGLVDAAIDGKLSLESLSQTFDTTGKGILATSDATSTLSGKFGVLKNNVKLALAEFAKPGLQLGTDLLAGALPVVQDLTSAFLGLPGPIKETIGLFLLAVAPTAKLISSFANFSEGAKALHEILGRIPTAIDGIIASASTGAGLGGIALGLGLITAAAGGTLFALGAFGEISSGVEADTKKLASEGVPKLSKSFDDITSHIAAVNSRLNDLQGIVPKGARSFADIASNAKLAGETMQRAGSSQLSADFAIATGKIKKLEDQIRSLAATSPSLAAKLIESAAAAKLPQEEIQKLGEIYNTQISRTKDLTAAHKKDAEILRDSGKSASDASTGYLGYTDAVSGSGFATDKLGKVSDDTKKSIEDLNATVLASSGGQVGYQQSVLQVEKAQSDLNDAIKQYGPFSTEATAAELQLQQAQLQSVQAAQTLDDANSKLIDTLHNSPAAIDAEIAKLEETKRLHPEVAAAIQDQINKLIFLKLTIEALPPDKTVTVDVSETERTRQTLADIDKINAFARLPKNAGGATQQFLFGIPSFPAPQTAKGGIFTTPQLRLFAEAGDEAVLPLSDPARSMQILGRSGLFDKMTDISAAGQGAPLVGTQVLQALDPSDLARKSASELGWLMKRSSL